MSPWLNSLAGIVSPEALDQARNERQTGKDPAEFLLRSGNIDRRQLLQRLSAFFDMPAMLLDQYEPEHEAIERVPEDVARRFGIMPLFSLRGHFFVAVSNPGDLDTEDYLQKITGLPVEQVVAPLSSIEQAINRHYLVTKRSAEKVQTIAAQQEERVEAKAEKAPTPAAEVRLDEETAPSIRMVNHILTSAVRLSVSDIHLEPFETTAMLRYRVDGMLREYPAPPLDMMKAVVSRIKILADLDISEKRLPQDGRCTYDVDGQSYDLRVSIIPNLYGESVVIRILDTGSERKTLHDLGFAEDLLGRYLKLVTRPHGVFLVTGPTGSGKTTTLYSTLRHILSPEKKILTLEDPVEVRLHGATQFQMNAAIGLTFARVLRAVLRHDPEIILIGEIRDLETAEIAIRASLTGHLLFSTLHTNDAPSAATRLIDMGIPGYMVMTSLLGVLAQRLVRRLCPACKAPARPEKAHLSLLGLDDLPGDATPFQAMGCARCESVGYKGRAAIYELMEVTPEMRRLAPEQMVAENLREIAVRSGFSTMRQSALAKWFDGTTGLEEVVKVTVEE